MSTAELPKVVDDVSVDELLKDPKVQDQIDEALLKLDASKDVNYIFVKYKGKHFRLKVSPLEDK
jgi:hypothetical protein